MPTTGATVARRVRHSPDVPAPLVPPARVEGDTADLGPGPSLAGPLDGATADEVCAGMDVLAPHLSPAVLVRARKAATVLLERLGGHPGASWQQRWESGVEPLGPAWADGEVKWRREQFVQGADALICLRVVRPNYPWLLRVKFNAVYLRWSRLHDPEVFARVDEALATRRGGLLPDGRVRIVLARVMIRTGKAAADVTGDDLERYVAATNLVGLRHHEVDVLWELLRELGVLDEPNRIDDRRRRPRLDPEQLVGRYRLACRPVRDVLVRYLASRAAEVDYRTLEQLACKLANNFWRDVEHHEPGVASLHLDAGAAGRWKDRLRSSGSGRQRASATAVLMAVRAFYLDVAQWAIADPAGWAAWACPSPVSAADTRSYRKERRHQQARMQARTRTLTPVLPSLVATAAGRLHDAEALLAAVTLADIGDEFASGGQLYRRAGFGSTTERRFREGRERYRVLRVASSDVIDPRHEESDAFWAWAVIEVLRHSGVRCEELLELTHLSVRRYRTPDGELIPLLQVSPSKTDIERVLPISPELARVLARIVTRLRGDAPTVPIAVRYDYHERETSAPLPFLFQRPTLSRPRVFTPKLVYGLLDRTAELAGLRDVDDTPLRFRPHDFRRIFATETVASGLPIHIAAKLLGHLDLNTTRGYLAVYPDEVIGRYQTFIAQRRTLRPGVEYRLPTDDEWTEFEQHFTLRKVALGRCARPYGTPCVHEHACERCPMLRVDPGARGRLLEMEHNVVLRIKEAEDNGWAGEVVGLTDSLGHIRDKAHEAENQIDDPAGEGLSDT